MLKQLKIYILVIAMSFVACNDDNEVTPLFEEESNTRVISQLEKYETILKSSQNGWKAAYQPDEDQAIFDIHFIFNEDNTVAITSDYNNGEDDLPSTYRVDIGQLPELIFENYSLLHKLFEVESFALGAEYEFVIDEISEEKIVLKSESDNGDQSQVTLVPASTTDKDQIQANQVQEERLKDDFDNKEFRTLIITDNTDTEVFKSNFSFNPVLRKANITGKNTITCAITSEVVPLKITETGFDFIKPVTIDGTEFASFMFDENSNSFTSTVGNLTATLSGRDTPGLYNEDVLLIENGKRSTYGYDIIKHGTTTSQSQSFWNIVTAIDANLLALGDGDKMGFYVLTVEPTNKKAYLKFGSAKIDGSNNSFNASYEYDLEISCDNIFKLTYVGLYDTGNGTGLANYWKNSVQPLLDFWASSDGFLYEEAGNFKTDLVDFSNPAGKFIKVNNNTDNFYGIWWDYSN